MTTRLHALGAFVASTVAAGAVLATAPTAFAADQDWYSRSEPLNVSDSGTLRGQAYGTAYQKNGYLKNHTNWRDRKPGNDHAVYTETSYSYYKVCPGGGSPAWCPEVGKDQSARSNSSDWRDQYDSDDYSSRGADRGRVHVKVCEDQKWSGDPCSRKPYFTFSL
ncbi:hypothetical protein [Pimelobacter sp. 30-1]|uniref:hypothetical protein n=1 Tax=Pimelobacter sp. 30-1 TaxID=2004991 RepID=UPI001C050099|nr:hypothetical protein [Pimelobacter sp. 30-1]MBU2694478.1 hypothetical protein [Pimelobacter sp. 30-1]